MASKLIVAGVLALDDLKTPHESAKGVVGGAGIYSSIASSLFQEIAKTESNQSDPSLIKKLKENRDKIKIIYANKNELEAHKNYFQN